MTGQRLIFGIFEGGGAKGIAHVGALAAVEANGLEFAGVAGASAGAIVATLVAAGLSSTDILDPKARGADILTRHGVTTVGVLGEEAWTSFNRFRRGGARFGSGLMWGGLGLGALFSWSAAKVVKGVHERRGHFSTAGVRDLVNRVLREQLLDVYATEGLPKSSVPDRVLFKHLDYVKFPIFRPLKIVATDLGQHALTVFDRTLTPDVEIGEAVAASVAIPLIFQPVTITSFTKPETGPFVDGGLISNSPAWVFADEKRAIERAYPKAPPVPIIGFTLVEKPASGIAQRSAQAALTGSFLIELGRTAIFGSQGVSQRFVDDLLVVPLETGLGLLDFDATWERVRDAHVDGRRAAAERLKFSLTVKPGSFRKEFAEAHDVICDAINRLRAQRGGQPLPRLRAKLVERSGPFSFRVIAAFNMDDDADDRLSLDGRGLGPPEAFRKRSPTLMQAGSPAPGAGRSYMTKYEQAQVRPSLHSAICVPVFRDVAAWALAPTERPEPLGVLCVDSDEDLSAEFTERSIQTLLVERSSVLSYLFDLR